MISSVTYAMQCICQQWWIQFTTVLSDCTYGAFATQITGTHKLQVQATAYVCSSVHSLPVRVDRQWHTSTQMLHYTAMFTTFLWKCLHPLLNTCIDKYMLLHYQSTYSTSHVCHPVHSGFKRPHLPRHSLWQRTKQAMIVGWMVSWLALKVHGWVCMYVMSMQPWVQWMT